MDNVGKAVAAVRAKLDADSGAGEGLPSPLTLVLEYSTSNVEALDPAEMAPLIGGLLTVATELAQRLGADADAVLKEIALRHQVD